MKRGKGGEERDRDREGTIVGETERRSKEKREERREVVGDARRKEEKRLKFRV